MGLAYEKLKNKPMAQQCFRQVADYSGPTGLIEDEIKKAKKKLR